MTDRPEGSGTEPPLDPEVAQAAAQTAQDVAEQVVSEQVRDVEQTVEQRAAEAEQARDGAVDAEAGAERARQGAVAAGQAAVEAVQLVVPADDPVLDTAARKIEAQVDEDNPFGVPGRPLAARSPFRVAFTAALGVALAYGLVQALISVRSVLLLLLTAAFLAIGLNPAVEALERRRMRRGFAVSLVLLGVLAFFTGFGFAVVPPIAEQVQRFVDQGAPEFVAQLQDNERVASVDARLGLLDRLEELLADPEELEEAAADNAVGVGRVVLGAAAATVTVLIVTLYFLANLPSMTARAYRLVPRSRRARVGLLADEILSRVGGYVAGAVLIAGLSGGSTYLLLTVLDVDYAVALAMLVFLTGLIPLIGASIGAFFVFLVALLTSAQAAVVVAVWFLVYQQVENYFLYPRVMQRSVDVSPAATVVAVLIGGSLLGVLGALLAIPIAAAVQLVVDEVIGPRQDAL